MNNKFVNDRVGVDYFKVDYRYIQFLFILNAQVLHNNARMIAIFYKFLFEIHFSHAIDFNGRILR